MKLKKSRIEINMKHIGLIVLLFLLIPVCTQAETVLRTGNDISVEADQVVDGDYYVSVGPFGRTVMSGSVVGDMYAVGASVTVNGEVGNDVSIFAGSSQLHAPITDDVRIFAGEVTIAEDVGGDVFVFAGSLSVLSTSHISGDIFFFGGDLVVEGDVDGSILGKAQLVNIDSTVKGNLDMTVSNGITLGDRANIAGSVRYTSFVPLTRGQGTVIGGEVMKTESLTATARQQARDILVPIFITLFATLSLYLLFKKELEKVVLSVEVTFSRNLLIGSVMSLFGPIAVVLLMVTVLGLLVGLMAFSIVLILYVAGFALSCVVFGAFVMKSITKRLEVTLLTILVGTVLLQLVLLIPVIGAIIVYIVFAVTVGALTQQMYHTVS